MNVLINEAIGLVTSAIEKKGAEATTKAAYAKVKKVRNRLLSLSSAPDQNTVSELNLLLKLEARLPEILGAYQDKLQRCFGTITDRKAIWIAHAHLAPNCKKITCGQETLIIPMHILDLLKTHSTYIQEQEKQEILLPNITKTALQQIIDYLSSGSKPTQGLVDFYLAADLLGIASLQTQADPVLSEGLSQQTWEELLNTLCTMATEKIGGKILREAALRAFILQECRYAHNLQYLPQPNPHDYIKTHFCQKLSLLMTEFMQQAHQNHPDFALYLEGLLLDAPRCDMNKAQRFGYQVSIVRRGSSVTRCIDSHNHEDYITASLYILDPGAGRYPDQTERQRAIAKPCKAKFELLRNNPRGWVQKASYEIKQLNMQQDYEQLIEEILLFKDRYEGKCLEKLEKICNVLLFAVYHHLKKMPEAKKMAAQLSLEDLKDHQELENTFIIYQYEMGIFKESSAKYYELRQQYLRNFAPVTSQDPLATTFEKIANRKPLYRHPPNYFMFGHKDWDISQETIANGTLLPPSQPLDFTFLNIQWNVSREDPIGSLVAICEQNPELAFPRIVLANYYWKNNQDQLCLDYCTAVLRLQKNPEIYFLRASLFLKQKKYDTAEEDCLLLMQLSFSEKYLLLYVRCLHEAFGFEKAMEYLNQLKPSSSTTCLKIELLLMDNQIDEADKLFKASSLSENALALAIEAKIALARGDYENALSSSLRVLVTNPNHLDALIIACTARQNFPIISRNEVIDFSQEKVNLRFHPDWQEPEIFNPFFALDAIRSLFWHHTIKNRQHVAACILLFEDVYKDPPEAKAGIQNLQTALSPAWQALSKVMLAHRLEDYDRVIELSSPQTRPKNPFEAALLADAYRRKGCFDKALETLALHQANNPAIAIVRTAVLLQKQKSSLSKDNIQDLKSAMSNCCIYLPFTNLGYYLLSQKAIGLIKYPRTSCLSSNHFWKSTEGLRALPLTPKKLYKSVLKFKARGYEGPAWDALEQETLEKIHIAQETNNDSADQSSN